MRDLTATPEAAFIGAARRPLHERELALVVLLSGINQPEWTYNSENPQDGVTRALLKKSGHSHDLGNNPNSI